MMLYYVIILNKTNYCLFFLITSSTEEDEKPVELICTISASLYPSIQDYWVVFEESTAHNNIIAASQHQQLISCCDLKRDNAYRMIFTNCFHIIANVAV